MSIFIAYPLLLLLGLACAAPGSGSNAGNREDPDAVTARSPSIRGTLTKRTPDRILIEEEPLDSSGSAKASLRLTATTRVVRGSGETARVEDLRVGQQVSAWFDGPVMQSYPIQAAAAAVRIESDEGAENQMEISGIIRYYELEGGFYAIRGDDGETYNPTNLPEAFRQDGLPVRAKIRPRHDMLGIHQAGAIVEIIEIRKR